MIQLIGKSAFSFTAELVDPNTGEDCTHATLLGVGDSIVQEAATTKWYKMDVAALKAMDKVFTFAMENLDGKAGKVNAYRPGEFIFQCPIFLPFHTIRGILKARIQKWFAIPFSSGPHFVRTLHHDLSVLGGSAQHSS